jgi:hypothetical protein
VGGEEGALVFDEAGGFFADVADALEGELAGDGVGVDLGGDAEAGGPTVGGFEELGELLAEVAMAWAVVVQVVVEFVGDGGELLEEVMEVLIAAGAAGLGYEILDGFGASVEELNKDDYAIRGDVGRLAELLDFGLREAGFAPLEGVERRGCKEEEEGAEGSKMAHAA